MGTFQRVASRAAIIVAVIAPWIGTTFIADRAQADEIPPVPGQVRLFWEIPSSKAPPGVPREQLAEWWIGQIVPMHGDGVLVSVFKKRYIDAQADSDGPNDTHGRLFFIRLNDDGTERWRANRPLCNERGSLDGCQRWDLDTKIVPMPDGGFFAFLGKRVWAFDHDGIFLDSDSVPRCGPDYILRDTSDDNTFFIAGGCEYTFDGTSLTRWAPDCLDCWQLRLPLHANGDGQYGYGLDLDYLADGNLLWTIYANPPMTLDPSTRWQVRVTPTGQIVPSGLLETSLQDEHGEWTLFTSALLPDGRLIRLLRQTGPLGEQPLRVEFWDGTGSRMLGARILDFGQRAGLDYDGAVFRPNIFYLDVVGSSAFYLASVNEGQWPMVDSLQIAGFGSTGDVASQTTWALDGRLAVGDGGSGRIYIAAHIGSWPERQTTTGIYVMTVE